VKNRYFGGFLVRRGVKKGVDTVQETTSSRWPVLGGIPGGVWFCAWFLRDGVELAFLLSRGPPLQAGQKSPKQRRRG
jgi:hypothetical protein